MQQLYLSKTRKITAKTTRKEDGATLVTVSHGDFQIVGSADNMLALGTAMIAAAQERLGVSGKQALKAADWLAEYPATVTLNFPEIKFSFDPDTEIAPVASASDPADRAYLDYVAATKPQAVEDCVHGLPLSCFCWDCRQEELAAAVDHLAPHAIAAD